MSSGSLSSDPAGWIAFEAAAGLESQYWLETENTIEGILNAGWDYPWDDDGTTPPTTSNFASIRSLGTTVERDYAGINSSGGPQVAGRADHDEFEVLKDCDSISPILYQFVSTGEQFSRVLIVFPEYGGSPRVEWLLSGVNLTLHAFIGDRINSSSLYYSADRALQEATSISSRAMKRFYLRRERVRLLYTSAVMRVGAGERGMSEKTDFRGWDTGTNTRILDYPKAP